METRFAVSGGLSPIGRCIHVIGDSCTELTGIGASS